MWSAILRSPSKKKVPSLFFWCVIPWKYVCVLVYGPKIRLVSSYLVFVDRPHAMNEIPFFHSPSYLYVLHLPLLSGLDSHMIELLHEEFYSLGPLITVVLE